MPTREEMGKALKQLMLTDSPQINFAWYETVAEKFAAWLEGERCEQNARWFAEINSDEIRKIRAGRMPLVADDVCSLPTSCCPHMNHPRDGDKVMPHRLSEHDALTCPKGHVLTHPEDIERRYCGACREYLNG